jgi:hypothetical protein
MKAPHVEIVPVVRREHAEAFANRWREIMLADLELVIQVGETGIMTWPSDDDPAGQDRYKDIEDEILESVVTTTKGAITDAFFMAATVVLDRERGR